MNNSTDLICQNVPDAVLKPLEKHKQYMQDIKLFEDYLSKQEMDSASIHDLKYRILKYLEFIKDEYDSEISAQSLQDFFELITLTDPDCSKTISTLSRYFKFHGRRDLAEVCRCYNPLKPDKKYRLTQDQERLVMDFMDYLVSQEKGKRTVQSYCHSASDFLEFLEDRPITKKNSILYKDDLKRRYKATSINVMIVGINTFLEFLDLDENLRLKNIKIQKSGMREDATQLTVYDFLKMYRKADEKFQALMLTLGLTGIRISELEYITKETVISGEVNIDNKGKIRTLFLNTQLQAHLLQYCDENCILSGPVFQTSTGNPLNRSNIWRLLRNLAIEAGVSIQKSNPHNFRRLFARLFYSTTHDISLLADILGHDSTNTTQLYLANSKSETKRAMEQIKLPTSVEDWNSNPEFYLSQGNPSCNNLAGPMGLNARLEEIEKKLDLLMVYLNKVTP